MATWIGAGLSAGVDTWLKTRAQNAREDELGQVGALRQEQMRDIQEQRQQRQDMAEAARMLASPDAASSDVTLAAGVPGEAPTPAVDPVEAQGAETMGGPGAAPAIPGAPAMPGTPGTPAVTKRYRTEADAMKTLGPDLYGRLAASEQGRQLLKAQGITPAAEIARQQKHSTVMQEVRGLLKKSEEAGRAGRHADAKYLHAAVFERLAGATDDFEQQARYMEKATALRNEAQSDAADPQVGEDYKAIWGAYDKMKQDPNSDNKLALIEATTSAKTKSGREFGQNALNMHFKTAQDSRYAMELVEGIRKHGSEEKALREMLKNPSQAVIAEVPKLLESKRPGVQRALGVEATDDLFGNNVEAKMAHMLTRSHGIDISTPQGMNALVKNYQAIVKQSAELKKDPNATAGLLKFFDPLLRMARKNVDDAREGVVKAGRSKTALAAANKYLAEARAEANDLMDTVNELLPGKYRLKHIGEDLQEKLDLTPKTVTPTGDPKKLQSRRAELVTEEVKALGGRAPTEADKVGISQRVQKRLQAEGLIAGPGK